MTRVWIVYPDSDDPETDFSMHPTEASAERFRTYCLAIGKTPSPAIETGLTEFWTPRYVWMSYSSHYPDTFEFWGDFPMDSPEQYYPPNNEIGDNYEGAVFKVEYTGDREELLRRCQARLDGFRASMTGLTPK